LPPDRGGFVLHSHVAPAANTVENFAFSRALARPLPRQNALPGAFSPLRARAPPANTFPPTRCTMPAPSPHGETRVTQCGKITTQSNTTSLHTATGKGISKIFPRACVDSKLNLDKKQHSSTYI
jgi:hypothetical protein